MRLRCMVHVARGMVSWASKYPDSDWPTVPLCLASWWWGLVLTQYHTLEPDSGGAQDGGGRGGHPQSVYTLIKNWTTLSLNVRGTATQDSHGTALATWATPGIDPDIALSRDAQVP